MVLGSGLISSAINFLITTVGSLGYVGIFVLMAIESSFIPLPSEIVLPPAGVLIAQGKLSWIGVLVFANLGSIAGALISYYLALLLGRRYIERMVSKYGKFFLIKKEHFLQVENYFQRHGPVTIFISRLLPGVRHLISLPAGFAKMNTLKFSFYTLLGAGIWSVVLVYIGYIYGNNTAAINRILNDIGAYVLILAGLIVILYIIFKKILNKKIK